MPTGYTAHEYTDKHTQQQTQIERAQSRIGLSLSASSVFVFVLPTRWHWLVVVIIVDVVVDVAVVAVVVVVCWCARRELRFQLRRKRRETEERKRNELPAGRKGWAAKGFNEDERDKPTFGSVSLHPATFSFFLWPSLSTLVSHLPATSLSLSLPLAFHRLLFLPTLFTLQSPDPFHSSSRNDSSRFPLVPLDLPFIFVPPRPATSFPSSLIFLCYLFPVFSARAILLPRCSSTLFIISARRWILRSYLPKYKGGSNSLLHGFFARHPREMFYFEPPPAELRVEFLRQNISCFFFLAACNPVPFHSLRLNKNSIVGGQWNENFVEHPSTEGIESRICENIYPWKRMETIFLDFYQ